MKINNGRRELWCNNDPAPKGDSPNTIHLHTWIRTRSDIFIQASRYKGSLMQFKCTWCHLIPQRNQPCIIFSKIDPRVSFGAGRPQNLAFPIDFAAAFNFLFPALPCVWLVQTSHLVHRLLNLAEHPPISWKPLKLILCLFLVWIASSHVCFARCSCKWFLVFSAIFTSSVCSFFFK